MPRRVLLPGRRVRALGRRRLGGTERNEEGSTLILTIFYAFLALAMILLVVAASSLYLERKRLLTLADGAALAGAEAFPLRAVGVGGIGGGGGEGTAESAPRPALDSADVRLAVQAHLAAVPHGGVDGLRLTSATSPDGQSAAVTLGAYWRPPVLTLFLPEGVPLEVTVVARSVFR